MNIDVQSLGFPITLALADHARRRLRFALTRHHDRIRRVVVRLGDENGPRGGADKFCRIRVYLIDAPVAVIADIGSDLYGVIDRTVDRVSRVVVKHLDRSRDNGRRVRVDRPTLLAQVFDPTPKSNHTEGERA